MRYCFRILPQPLPLQQYLLKRLLLTLCIALSTRRLATRRALLLLTARALAEQDFDKVEVEGLLSASWRGQGALSWLTIIIIVVYGICGGLLLTG